VEQWLARWAHNPKVGGSNPPPATEFQVRSERREKRFSPCFMLLAFQNSYPLIDQ
jgi:hypothetical protein